MAKVPARRSKKKAEAVGVLFRADRILEQVTKQLRNDTYWLDAVKRCRGSRPSKRLHLAIFIQPYLNYILEGKKKVESRFSVNRVSPHWQINEGDVVLLKKAGGPIVGICAVSRSWTYEVNRELIAGIREEYREQLRVDDPDFWAARTKARYATLILFADVRAISPIAISKTDRRGWVVLSGPNLPELDFFDD